MGDTTIYDAGMTTEAARSGQEPIDGCGKDDPSSDRGLDIKRGDTVLNLYEVVSDPIKGGMGRVVKVHHPGWGVDLAMKQPHAHLFLTDTHKETFIHECNAWIDLGFQSQIVACYYVRQVDGIPSIFSEWMEGGSLSDWMRDGRLYAGSIADQLERIIDIAIQSARGLGYAHEQGLIHQDVKPDNILLSADGKAKVADFGIAQARCAAQSDTSVASVSGVTADPTMTMVSGSGAYTPAYCSPEQMNGRNITRRTDIWSWAVTLLEMLLRHRPWPNGAVAGYGASEYFSMIDYSVPDEVTDMLCRCFHEDDASRPHDFSQVEECLTDWYKMASSGKHYTGKSAHMAADTPIALNNRALTYLDLGDEQRARECWDKALLIDAVHLESVFNHSVYQWRNGEIPGYDARSLIERAVRAAGETPHASYLFALFKAQQGDLAGAQECLDVHVGYAESESLLAAIRAQGTFLQCSFGKVPINHLFIGPDEKWAVSTGKRIGPLFPTGDTDRLESDAISYSPTPLLWDLDTQKIVRELDIMESTAIMMSPDGRIFVVLDSSTSFYLVDTKDWRRIDCDESRGRIVAIDFSPDGETMYVARRGSALEAWDIRYGALKARHQFGHTVTSIACFPDGQKVLVCHDRYEMKKGLRYCVATILDTSSFETVGLIRSKDHYSYDMAAIKGDGRAVAMAGYYGGVRVWNLATSQELYSIDVKDARNIGFSPEGNLLLVQSESFLYLYQSDDGNVVDRLLDTGFSITQKKLYIAERYSGVKVKRWGYPLLGGGWALSRVKSTEDQVDEEMRTRSYVDVVKMCITMRDIEGALEAMEKAYAVPGFSGSKECYDTSKELGRYCRITGVRCEYRIWQVFHKNEYRVSAYDEKRSRGFVAPAIIDLKDGEILHQFSDSHTHRPLCFLHDGRIVTSNGYTSALTVGVLSEKNLAFTEVEYGIKDYVEKIDALPGKSEVILNHGYAYVLLVDIDSGSSHKISLSGKVLDQAIHPNGESAAFIVQRSERTPGVSSTLKPRSLVLYDLFRDAISWQYDFDAESETMAFCPCGRYVALLMRQDGQLPNSLVLLDSHTGEQVFFCNDAGKANPFFSQDGRYLITGKPQGVISRGGQEADNGGEPSGGRPMWDIATGKRAGSWNGPTHVFPVPYHQPVPQNGDLVYPVYDYEFPGWADWDEGAAPFIKIFLATEGFDEPDDIDWLLEFLACHGFGWLRPDGVRAQIPRIGAELEAERTLLQPGRDKPIAKSNARLEKKPGLLSKIFRKS